MLNVISLLTKLGMTMIGPQGLSLRIGGLMNLSPWCMDLPILQMVIDGGQLGMKRGVMVGQTSQLGVSSNQLLTRLAASCAAPLAPGPRHFRCSCECSDFGACAFLKGIGKGHIKGRPLALHLRQSHLEACLLALRLAWLHSHAHLNCHHGSCLLSCTICLIEIDLEMNHRCFIPRL